MGENTQAGNNNKWVWIGLAATILVCCCAALFAWLVFRQVGQQVQQGMKTDPASASKAAHEIVDYDLPQGYEEKMAMDLGFYAIAMLGPVDAEAPGPIIMLAQFSSYGMDPEQMEQQLRQSFEQQSGRRGMNMELVEVKKMTIRGEETDVAVFEGTDEFGNSLRQLLASFPGKDGTVMMMIMGDTQAWDEELVENFINSLR
jgi:hypothetical protein